MVVLPMDGVAICPATLQVQDSICGHTLPEDQFFTLHGRIKNAKTRRSIRGATRGPLPAESVLRKVGIHEPIPEPTSALQPGEQQILNQE